MRQHIIPKVYLGAFCDPRPPVGHASGKPFTPALWVFKPSLEGKPKRVAPKNILWTREAYTLTKDDPKRPALEASLSRLEATYSSVMRRVESREPLTIDDRAQLALFVGALYARTTEMMASRQSFFDKLAGFSRAYLGGAPTETRHEPWEDLTDVGKRQIVPSAQALAEVTGPRMILVENQSRLPFIISDNPVTYRKVHADELLALRIPEELLFRGIPRSARSWFAFCPLTPRLAYVSSEFFPPRPDMSRIIIADEIFAFLLNELTRIGASDVVLAPSPRPYGPLLGAASAHDARLAAAADNPEVGIHVYSKNERYWLRTTTLDHGQGEHPLTGRLRFRTADMTTLRAIAAENDLVEISILGGKEFSGGMRDAWFVRVALRSDEESVIENGPLKPS